MLVIDSHFKKFVDFIFQAHKMSRGKAPTQSFVTLVTTGARKYTPCKRSSSRNHALGCAFSTTRRGANHFSGSTQTILGHFYSARPNAFYNISNWGIAIAITALPAVRFGNKIFRNTDHTRRLVHVLAHRLLTGKQTNNKTNTNSNKTLHL